MISGIKRQPVRGPHRRVVARLEDTEVLECGHKRAVRPSKTPRARRTRELRRKCETCFAIARRQALEAEARAV